MNIIEIKKEQISDMVFPKKDVLRKDTDKKQRKEKLEQAMLLSNGSKQKAKIVFRDLLGFNFVYTTVWFVSDIHVQLKSGILMPIGAIIDVIL